MRQRVITAVVALAFFIPIIYFDFFGISVGLLSAALALPAKEVKQPIAANARDNTVF